MNDGIKKLRLFICTLLIIIPITVSTVYSAYPEKPITMVCGWGAGGMMDVSARALSKIAEKELGQPIIMENKTGAAGVIAGSYVANAKPDGYTIGVTVTSIYMMQPQMRKTPYNPLTDFTDIMTYTKYTMALAVKADSPWKSIDDVIDYARKNPGQFKYAHGGVGTIQHISMERIAMNQKVKFSQVPFKNGAEAVTSALGGHTDGVMQGPLDVLPHVQAGKLRLLMVVDEKRWPAYPDVPTILEKYNFLFLSYMCIHGPKNIPEPVKGKLDKAFRNAVADPEFQRILKNGGLEPIYVSGEETTKKWKSMYKEVGESIRALGIAE